MLAREFPEARFIQCEKNVGFAKANNLGFEPSQGDCVLFLNPDTEVVGPAINVLRDALLNLKDAGIVGARLLNTDGSVQTSCIQTFPTIFNQVLDADLLRQAFPRLSFWGTAPLFGAGAEPVEVQVLTGACMMMQRAVFDKIGRFGAEYFMYSEDLDLCYKSRQFGCKNYHVPNAVIIHHGGGSSQQSRSEFSTVMMRESVYRFLTKVRGKWYGAGFRASLGLSAIGRLGLLLLVFPFRIIQGEVTSARNSIRKWIAILKWVLGLESWIGNY